MTCMQGHSKVRTDTDTDTDTNTHMFVFPLCYHGLTLKGLVGPPMNTHTHRQTDKHARIQIQTYLPMYTNIFSIHYLKMILQGMFLSL